ncbi:MAG: RHS repeat protein [Sterolibacteriaceae bacterium]|uniref:RHS repeat protein n=1 Tax=Candidatus Methylophosphatis roskildensis TaxID=2899263 RepID=A0A9D7E2P5_9PROT|nr:RHS repeat protein [Candidatus Methylophosphatis roskildensis]
MSDAKVLIDAQWRPDHFAAPVAPSFKATALKDRMVPTIPAVAFIVVENPSQTVRAESGHPLFLLRSIARDPLQKTQFVPDEAAGTNPVEGSLQCVHGNGGMIEPIPGIGGWPSPPIPGAINCGVIGSDHVQCLENLKQMIELFANRLYSELADSPFAFYRNYQKGRTAAFAAWGEALPGRVVDGVIDTAKGLWDGVKWVGGKVWGGVKAVGGAVAHPVDTYYSAVEGATAAMEAVDRYASMAAEAAQTLLDPQKREAVIEALKQWLLDQLGGVACPAADALLEMMKSDKPLAIQMGELSATIEVKALEVAGQVAITVLGDKGISKLAMLSKAGKLGGFGEDIGKLFDRIGDAVRNAGTKPRKLPSPNDPEVPPKPKKPHDDKRTDEPDAAGGTRGKATVVGCKNACNFAGRPISTAYGCKVLFGGEDLDFDLPAPLPLPWQRSYASDFPHVGWLGQGWSLPFSIRLERTAFGLDLIDEQGRRIPLPVPPPGEPYYSRFEQFTLSATGNNGYEIALQGGEVRLRFAALAIGPRDPQGESGSAWVLAGILDRNDNLIRILYSAAPPPDGPPAPIADAPDDASAQILPFCLVDSAGRALLLEFAPTGLPGEATRPGESRGMRLARVEHALDAAERALLPPEDPAAASGRRTLVEYGYSDEGDLIEVRNALGELTRRFDYRNHVMVMHALPGGLVSRYEYDDYSETGKVLRNWLSDGRQWRFDYAPGETAVSLLTPDNPQGTQERWYHDEAKHYTGKVDALGGRLARQLDSFGNLQQLTDEAGRTTRYDLDARGRPVQISAPDGAITRIAYHPTLHTVAAITDPLGASTAYVYDARGNLSEVSDALGQITRYSYDQRGLPIAITDALGKTKHLAYNRAGQLIRYTDCSAQRTDYAYDPWGSLASVTDALGKLTRYRHDPLGRLLEITHPDGAVERFDYDGAGRLIAYTDPLGARTTYTLAPDGLPLERRNALGAALRYEYDGARRLSTLFNENAARTDFAYDALDRLIEESGFDGRTTRYRYDPVGQLAHKLELGCLSAQQRLELRLARAARANDWHDPPADGTRGPPSFDDPWGLGPRDQGAPLKAPPGQAIVTRYGRDPAGRLTAKEVAGHIVGADGKETQYRRTRYEYDAAGRLTAAINDGGARTTLAYDALDRLIEERRTGQGLHTVLAHQYDALGNRLTTTLPDGRRIGWLHYGSGHLHQISVDGKTICDIERDPLHREIGRSQGALTSRYGHDAQGRLVSQQVWRTAPLAGGARSSPPRPAWEALGDELDPLTGTRRHLPAGPTEIARRYQYDGAGNLLQIDDARAGITRYAYDRIGRLTGAQQPTLAEVFAFDPAHNLVPPQATASGASGASTGFVRDNRLEVFEDNRYAYDAHGNLLEKRIGRHTTIELCWDVEHQLSRAIVTRKGSTQTIDYAYDGFGRRIAKRDGFGQTLFTWDGNRLLAERRGSKETIYLYEPDSFAPLAQLVGEVVASGAGAGDKAQAQALPQAPPPDEDIDDWQPRKTCAANVERLLAEQRKVVAQAHGRRGSAPAREAANEPPRTQTRADEKTDKVVDLAAWRIRYYHNDHLGTPRELTNDDGQIVWRATYKAWGNVLKVEQSEAGLLPEPHRTATAIAQQQEIEQPLRFQGQYFDSETGLHYNRFRYYDPDCGRFVSQDPIGLQGGMNVYRYAANPTAFIDPWGLEAVAFKTAGKTLCIKDKFPAGSAASKELQEFTRRWNDQIKKSGGSMTRRTLSEKEQKESRKWRASVQCKCPPGTVAGHVPDAGAGGSVIPKDWMPQMKETNAYVGGIIGSLPVGYSYDSVRVVTDLGGC